MPLRAGGATRAILGGGDSRAWIGDRGTHKAIVMIDIRIVRETPDLVRQACERKRMPCNVDQVLEVDARRRALETEFNTLRHEQKLGGERIAKASKEERAALTSEMTRIKTRVKEIEEQLQAVDAVLQQLLLLLPQIPSPDAPVGASAADNIEVKRVGVPRPREEFGFPFKDHVELGQALHLYDFDRGVKLAGSRNYVLTGLGSELHEAVLRLAWDLMTQSAHEPPGRTGERRAFTPLTVPVLVNDRLMYGTGFFPLHREEVYLVERDGQSLVGTAEVPVTALHMDEVLEDAELPKLYFARSTCFRREAGAAGKDTRGLYRIHFFDKIEQVVICRADATEAAHWHRVIIENAEKLLQALELPYRLLEVCTGDMGQGKFRMFDIETWMPSRGAYGETHSASNLHDFQARRLGLRYRDANGKVQFCYTLNNTVVASPRILIPLIELNQQADGSVRLPRALQPYLRNLRELWAGDTAQR
ncbi:MAG: serine--tRNA ligase [Phycisphaerae bacterium]